MAAPIHKLNKQGIAIAIWGDANNPRISFEKRYKDKQSGLWKDSKYLFENEVQTLVTLLQEAQGWIVSNRTTGGDVQEVMGAKFQVTSDDDIDDLPF